MKQPHVRRLTVDLAAAFGGALIFSMPVLLTQEMWDLGYSIDRGKLLILLALSFPLLMLLAHYCYFAGRWTWRSDLRAVGIAYGVGLVTSLAILSVLNAFDDAASPSDALGKLLLQIVPAALGAALSRSQLGIPERTDNARPGYFGELGVMIVGALFLCLHAAPTEEITFLVHRMETGHVLLLMIISIAVMHGFTFAEATRRDTALNEETSALSLFFHYTIVGYVVAIAISAYLLWTFSSLDGLQLGQVIEASIILGFPAAVGAGAARLLI